MLAIGRPIGTSVSPDHGEQGVDHGIAGHFDARLGHAFHDQVGAGARRGREVQRGEWRGEPPVHFLGPGAVYIMCTQTGLYVTDRNLLIKRYVSSYRITRMRCLIIFNGLTQCQI